jgi:hypothetical protein
VLTNDERTLLNDALTKLTAADEQLIADPSSRTRRLEFFDSVRKEIAAVVGSTTTSDPGSLRTRLERTPRVPGEVVVPYRQDSQTRTALQRARSVSELNESAFSAVEHHLVEGKPGLHEARAELQKVREETLLLAGAGELPARNVANIGYLLYADHLLAVELAGTLLLVATIGAIAIAKRRGNPA